jgi:hypothetical protein
MKHILTKQTLRIAAAIFWLSLLPTTSRLVAQSFYNPEDALEEAEFQAGEIESLTAEGLRLIPQLQQALEDGDFRAQGPLFKKINSHLSDIENYAIALQLSASEAARLDPRLDLDVFRIEEASVYIGSNEDFAYLSLMEAVGELHEGDLFKAESALREAGMALQAIGALARVAEDEIRALLRSF